MTRPSNDLLGVAVVAAMAMLLNLLEVDNAVLRLLTALPLVLFIPGYTLTAAFFPRYALKDAEQLLFSVGLSLATSALGGLILNLTPWGLQPRFWTAFLFVVTLSAAIVALIRRERGFEVGTTPTVSRLGLGQVVLLSLAALVIIGAVRLSQTPAPPEGHEGYSVLWLQPASSSRPQEMRVGVTSYEFAATGYRLRMEVNGQAMGEEISFQLEPGEAWETTLTITQPGTEPVRALLYRQGAPPDQVYRQVLWWPESP